MDRRTSSFWYLSLVGGDTEQQFEQKFEQVKGLKMTTKSAKIKRFNKVKRELKEMTTSDRSKAILSLVLSTYAEDFDFGGTDTDLKVHIARHVGQVREALENF